MIYHTHAHTDIVRTVLHTTANHEKNFADLKPQAEISLLNLIYIIFVVSKSYHSLRIKGKHCS